MKTRAGIYYDLSKSEYRKTVDDVTFVFSSRLHMSKFMGRYQRHRDSVNESLSKRFSVAVDLSTLADIVLYSKIENRGFLIVTKEGSFSCRKSLQLDGGHPMRISCGD